MTYRVSFFTKKGGLKNYICDVEAKSKKAAIEAVSEMWYQDNITHAFQMSAEKIDKPVYNKIYRLLEY